MTASERKQMLAAIFDSVTASVDGVDRLEPCENRRRYVIAAIPKPVTLNGAPTERKTGRVPAHPPAFVIREDDRIEPLRPAA